MKEFSKPGKKYLIRTVTMIYTGKLVRVEGDYIVVTNCAWIADTSRWMKRNGDF